ncbi:MAG: hypothetical protein ACOC57_05540 [Acidobacteriota bacterium]
MNKTPDVLSLLKITPLPQSKGYVKNKKQYQLHSLITEQRHPRTWNLTFTIKKNIKEGLNQILSVDEDISLKFNKIAGDEKMLGLIERASRAVTRAIREKKKIFIFGCGSTGRLAKQMESAIWRPFWKKIKKSPIRQKLAPFISEHIEELLIGEITGGDRAFISALEGFEDLEIMGELQLAERGIGRGDVVFCITEGGETSSVIGAVLGAVKLYGRLTQEKTAEAKNNIYFIFNNPEEVLMPLERSRRVLENPAVTKINLTTGPQAVTGSTRMQAATSETFILGLIIESGIQAFLESLLTKSELTGLGFHPSISLREKLISFPKLRKILSSKLDDLARFTYTEAKTYRSGGRTTYCAGKALPAVFVDCAERSPTFHLPPLDTVCTREPRSWVQVWTKAPDRNKAWNILLGRPFKGLDESFYRSHILNKVKDTYLKETAIKSLAKAGKDQAGLYDFSFSGKNISSRSPKKEDMGIIILQDEELKELRKKNSSFIRFARLFKKNEAALSLILLPDSASGHNEPPIDKATFDSKKDCLLLLPLEGGPDPLGFRKQVLLKMLLNTHSTGVMAILGKVVGNTMTSVNPSNLKLIGRATYLIKSHVNDVLGSSNWNQHYGRQKPLSYAQANAVLFDALEFTGQKKCLSSEVTLSIIRILEALRKKSYVSWEEALSIAEKEGLENYISRLNPGLLRAKPKHKKSPREKH